MQPNELRELFERLTRIEANLSEHMRRTEVAERRLELVEDTQEDVMRNQAQWAGAGKLLAVIGTGTGILVAFWRVLG